MMGGNNDANVIIMCLMVVVLTIIKLFERFIPAYRIWKKYRGVIGTPTYPKFYWTDGERLTCKKIKELRRPKLEPLELAE